MSHRTIFDESGRPIAWVKAVMCSWRVLDKNDEPIACIKAFDHQSAVIEAKRLFSEDVSVEKT